MPSLSRLLSHLWPIRIARVQGKHGPLDVVWQNGTLVIDSASANQSYGSLHTIWQRAFQMMRLEERHVERALVLGLGGGSIVQIMRRELRIVAPIVAVDDDPVMVELAREHFGLDRWKNVTVITADAFEAIMTLEERFDLILIDLFHDDRIPKGLAAAGTIGRLHQLLARDGLLLVNTMARDAEGRQQGEALLKELEGVGLSVRSLSPLPENRVLAAVHRRLE